MKPIYAELSGVYYVGGGEGEVDPDIDVEKVRAVRIGCNADGSPLRALAPSIVCSKRLKHCRRPI